eukprot:Skav204581  [mRNA]  locus=scaffold672:20747:26257:+ [translate_table: standard]
MTWVFERLQKEMDKELGFVASLRVVWGPAIAAAHVCCQRWLVRMLQRLVLKHQERLDVGWDNVMAGHFGEFASKHEASKNELAFVLQSATSFNRWLMIENALAAEIPRLLVPEKTHATTKTNPEGHLQKVEKRAEFMNLILDHFLLYLAVVSKMRDETISLPGDQRVLQRALRNRAVEMAKKVLPNLAVMWEKQWDSAWMNWFYPPWSLEETRHQMDYAKDWWLCSNAFSAERKEFKARKSSQRKSSLEQSSNSWLKRVKEKVQTAKNTVKNMIKEFKKNRASKREEWKKEQEEKERKEASRLTDDQSECFNQNDLHLRMLQKYQKFQRIRIHEDRAYKDTGFVEKLMATMNNQLLYGPSETRPAVCSKEWEPKNGADFIVDCLWYPLYGHRSELQTVDALHLQRNFDYSDMHFGAYFHEYKIGLVWSFFLHDPCLLRRSEPVLLYTSDHSANVNWPEEMSKLSAKLKCEKENQIISKVFLRQNESKVFGIRWTPLAAKECSALPKGFFFVSDATFTFDASEFNQDRGILPWQIPCAHKHAVLVEVEFKGEAMISTCRFVSKECN